MEFVHQAATEQRVKKRQYRERLRETTRALEQLKRQMVMVYPHSDLSPIPDVIDVVDVWCEATSGDSTEEDAMMLIELSRNHGRLKASL